jgi:hypothetical protein
VAFGNLAMSTALIGSKGISTKDLRSREVLANWILFGNVVLRLAVRDDRLPK